MIAFSAFNNFGLLARQRSQVIPYFMAVVIAYGWNPHVNEPDPGNEEATARETAAA